MPPAAFDTAFDAVIGVEGGFVDNPNDSGGATKYGITQRVARANGYQGAMQDLPLGEARRIAKLQYWDPLRLDDVAGVAPQVARELFDSGYNVGTGQAGTWLQRALNALNRQQADFGDMKVDGQVGAVTVAALREFLRRRPAEGETVLLRALNALQGAFYIDLAERRPKDEAFVFGWLARRVWG